MNSAVWGEFAFGFEERWARSVVYAEFQTRERIAPGSPIYGRLQTRRLIQGEYCINFGGNVAWFDARTRSDSVWSGGGGVGGGPGVRDANEYIELQQWDNLARRYRVLYGESARGELEVHHTQLDLGTTGEQHMAVSFTVHDQGERSKGEWYEVGYGVAAYSFVADAAAAPTVIHGRAFLDELESKSYATLGVRHNQENSEWELVAMIHHSEFEWEDEITFGGAVSVELEQPDGGRKLYRRLLRGPSKWWRWVPGTRPAPDMDENTSEYWEHWREGELIPSGRGDPYFDGYGIPFHDDDSFARFQNDDGRLVLRVRADSVRESQIVYADLEADRVIAGDLVFPIRSWTVEELNAYRISGLVPRHAMPN